MGRGDFGVSDDPTKYSGEFKTCRKMSGGCGGSGTIRFKGHYVNCARCKGTGMVKK